MAFVLVALVVFFAMAAMIYLSISIANIKDRAETLYEKEALEIARSLASSPELILSSSPCEGCIDLDKALQLKYQVKYQEFWNLDYLAIKRIYPIPVTKAECDLTNYPDNCDTITIIPNKTADIGSTARAFVSLARRHPTTTGDFKYEIGKLYTSDKDKNG